MVRPEGARFGGRPFAIRPLRGDDATVKQVFISINGDDSRSGLTRAEAIKSWKRLMQLSKGNAEWVLMEGDSTKDMLSRAEFMESWEAKESTKRG